MKASITALLIGLLFITPSCSTVQRESTQIQPSTVETSVELAAYFGGKKLIELDKANIERIEIANNALADLIAEKVVTGSLIRQIVSALPIQALKSDTAQVAVAGATLLYDIAAGKVVNLEKSEYAMAAAIGLHEGFTRLLKELKAPAPKQEVGEFHSLTHAAKVRPDEICVSAT